MMPAGEPSPPEVEALAAEMADHPGIRLDLRPGECLALVGNLQLALRHPGNHGETADWARALIDRIGDVSGPEFRRLIAAGA